MMTVIRGELVISLEGLNAEDAQWVSECLCPWFLVAVGRQVDWRVSVNIDPSAYKSVSTAGPAAGGRLRRVFSFQSQDWDYPEWCNDPLTVQDPELELFYRFFPRRAYIEIVSFKYRTSLRVALLRIVREIASHYLEYQGQTQFHAAALSYKGKGFLVCGPRRAGKTSFITHALLDPASRYIANDRAIINYDVARDSFIVSGMPTLVTIREGTTNFFSGLALSKFYHWRARMTLAESLVLPEPEPGAEKSAKLVLSPAQYHHLLGIHPVVEAPLWVMLFPRVDTAYRGSRLIPLCSSDIAMRLKSEMLMLDSDVLTGIWPSDRGVALTRDLVTALSTRCTGYECVLGSGAYDYPSILTGLVD